MVRGKLRQIFGSAYVAALLLALTIIPIGIVVAGAAAPRSQAPRESVQPVTVGAGTATMVLDKATQETAAAVGPSVVKIESAGGLGSGVIVDPRGYIVTNYHVLFGGRAATAPQATYTVTLADGASHRATVAGSDAADDLAVLKINARNLRALPLADSDRLRVGQFVLAVGNPLGYAQSVTFGIVSTLRRTIAENGPAAFIPDMVQTSAPINPGNSGGALVDLQGRLVGIPTLQASDPRLGTAAQGIGFAVSSNRVAHVARQIIADGKVTHSGRPYLGVSGLREVTPALAVQYGLRAENGMLVARVERDGPADRAGLRPGDIVTRLDGRPTLSEAAFGDALARLKPGQRVPVVVVAERGERTVTITLGELPAPR